jgi:hypothetical protein
MKCLMTVPEPLEINMKTAVFYNVVIIIIIIISIITIIIIIIIITIITSSIKIL